MIDSAIYNILISDGDVNDAVSGRVYPMVVPQYATYPCIRQFSRAVPTDEKNGVSQLDIYSLQIDVYAEDLKSTVDDIASDVRTALDRISGQYGTLDIDSIKFDGWENSYEEEENIWRHISDYTVRVKR